MASRLQDLERRTLLVQFVAVAPLTFYATSDGTDLVQNILHSQLARTDADIFGQEGSLSINDNGEFLTFEPTDTKNRTLHLPIEHLAYSGALRRMRYDPSDQRNPDQIQRREFENVDLANRYAHYIAGPPIFVAVFHGFDNALCYTFITQSADDACLLVMKIMRAFRQYEQQLEEQGQANQGPSPHTPVHSRESPSVIEGVHGNLPLHHSSQAVSIDNRHILPPPTLPQLPNMYAQNLHQDDFIQQLLRNPNLQIVNQPYSSSSSAPLIGQHIDGFPMLSGSEPSVCYPPFNQPTTIVTQQNPSVAPTMLCTSGSAGQLIGGSTSLLMRPPSPPILGVNDAGLSQSFSMGHGFPQQVIYKPNNQDLNYRQNVIVRWLKPPTPPPPAPIIIREIQCPPTVPPPIICRQVPPCPPTPPPIIVRERPPPYPPPGNPLIIEKRLPPACLPRQVIVQRCPPPPPKPQPIIYEKYLPCPPPPHRQVIVQRETCQQNACAPATRPAQCRRLVREVIRQVPQQCAPATVCTPQTQQTITPGHSQAVQQFVPVFAQRQHVVQPKGVRVIRQVIGPAQPCTTGQFGVQQAIPQMYAAIQ